MILSTTACGSLLSSHNTSFRSETMGSATASEAVDSYVTYTEERFTIEVNDNWSQTDTNGKPTFKKSYHHTYRTIWR